MQVPAYDDPFSVPRSEAARVGRLLALQGEADVDDVTLARCIAKGLAPKSAVALAHLLDVALQIRGGLVPGATLRRALKGEKRLSRIHSERLYEVGRVLDATAQLFHGDAGSIRAFLVRPHPMLDGESPIAMARSGSAGCTAVLDVIRRAEVGIVV